MHLVLVVSLGLYLPIHLYILAILICRLVDLSTCRPSAIVNKKDPVRVMVRLGLVLAILAILICRLVDLSTCRPVDLSTCRPSAIVNNNDPVRVRVRLGLVLRLVCG